jgi:hypothetical protein
VCVSHLHHACFMPRLSPVPWSDHLNHIRSSLCSFLHLPVTSSLFSSNILLGTLFSDILKLPTSTLKMKAGSFFEMLVIICNVAWRQKPDGYSRTFTVLISSSIVLNQCSSLRVRDQVSHPYKKHVNVHLKTKGLPYEGVIGLYFQTQ